MDNLHLVAELRFIQYAMRRIGVLRCVFTYHERLRIAELMRDAADELDRGETATPRCTISNYAGGSRKN